MSYAEALQFEQVWWGELNAQRQMSINQFPKLLLRKRTVPREETI